MARALCDALRVQFVPMLPKTRSGKIMRRILRKIATDQTDDIGDTSTLANPYVVDKIIEGYKTIKSATAS
jgi:acetyl-CoA synthetase